MKGKRKGGREIKKERRKGMKEGRQERRKEGLTQKPPTGQK
jgi:hypothetical protein